MQDNVAVSINLCLYNAHGMNVSNSIYKKQLTIFKHFPSKIKM